MKTRRGYVYTSCGQVHYRTCGPDAAATAASADSAPVLVLSHQSPSSSLMYEAAYPLLAAVGIVCIGVDTPGYGQSDVPDPRPSVLDYAAIFAPVLDHFGLERAHFLGHHTGAANVTAFAARNPERVSSLILNGPPLYDAAELAERRARKLGPSPLRADGAHLKERWEGRLQVTPGWTNVRAMHRNLMGTLWAGDTSWYGHKAAFEYDLMADFVRLTPRTLILTNTGDDLYKLAQRARALRPDMAYRELEGGTHDIVDEQPAAWAAAVATFVRAT
jgi:pimeloyl-ACP methyl ester carboxylesterase